MTKQEKEIFNWILDRSREKKANPVLIAKALAQLFPGGGNDVMKELEKTCDWCLEEIKYGEIFRVEIWIFERDLCATCKAKWENESSM